MTRVLQVIYGLGMGGAETWLMSLLRLFSHSGDIKMDFLVTCGERRIFDDDVKKLGASLHYIKYSRSSVLQFRRSFRELLRTGKYDALHNHQDIHSGYHYMLAGSYAPPVLITHLHNPIYQLSANYATSPPRRLTVAAGTHLVRRYSTHILGTSSQLIREYGFYQPRFHHILRMPLHCGFDSSLFTGDNDAYISVRREFGWSQKSRLILFAGRLDYAPDFGAASNHKNSGFAVNVLIEAMKMQNDLVAVFAGASSPALPILKERIEMAGFAERIIFAGLRHDIPRLMQASDALLFPSRGEGLGMVAVEAQAAGLPVLASTAVPRECVIVSDLVKFLDLREPIGAWAEELLASANLEVDQAMANSSVAASHFDINNSAAELKKIYQGYSD